MASAWAMILSVPATAGCAVLLMGKSTSWLRAVLVSSLTTLAVVAPLTYWFSVDVVATSTDPVIGFGLYIYAPLVALAATVGVMFAMGRSQQRRDPDGSPRGLLGVMAWGVVLVVLGVYVAGQIFSYVL